MTETFGSVSGMAAAYLTPGGDKAPTLALRAGGKKVFGSYPYFEAAYLGGGLGGFGPATGDEPVRGLQRHRYAGDAAIYGNADLRIYVSRMNIILPGTWGILGFGDVGRVYYSPESSDTWHTGYGGGLWFAWLDRANTSACPTHGAKDTTPLCAGRIRLLRPLMKAPTRQLKSPRPAGFEWWAAGPSRRGRSDSVEACGVCHTDAAVVSGLSRPGAAAGSRTRSGQRIDALGNGVSRWKIGQRVGVGFFGGEDGVCEPCRRGDMVNCRNAVYPGVTTDGGYAEVMIAEARGIASIPEELPSAEAAPLLCAGITTYNALRNAGLRGGDLVAVQGIGGLGHLAVQFARRMGFRTVAIGRGPEKEALAKELGAHVYVDTARSEVGPALQGMGGARAILATAPSGAAMGPLVSGLATRGKLIVVGAPTDPLQLSALPLIFGGRSIHGSLAGTAIETEDTLAFSVLQGIRPMIETAPLERAADAYARMMEGKARFRMVLTMAS